MDRKDCVIIDIGEWEHRYHVQSNTIYARFNGEWEDIGDELRDRIMERNDFKMAMRKHKLNNYKTNDKAS